MAISICLMLWELMKLQGKWACTLDQNPEQQTTSYSNKTKGVVFDVICNGFTKTSDVLWRMCMYHWVLLPMPQEVVRSVNICSVILLNLIFCSQTDIWTVQHLNVAVSKIMRLSIKGLCGRKSHRLMCTYLNFITRWQWKADWSWSWLTGTPCGTIEQGSYD